MNFERIYRHGDVIIFKFADNPYKDSPTKAVEKVTLALGEVTGHSHQLKGDIELLETKLKEDEIAFHVQDKAVLTHEEHDTMVLDQGYYLKVNQVEYDPFKDLVVYIRD